MELIKENFEKHRRVFRDEDKIRKIWTAIDHNWLTNHVTLLEEVIPGYILGWGIRKEYMFIDCAIVPGVPASEFEHTDEFVDRIKNFCLKQITNTEPYAHGDWALSNILVDGDTMRMVDWDNLGKYEHKEIIQKLNEDLSSAFGEKYQPIV